jgi:ATP-dependent Clp protease ATP-binding subunit ClpA
MFERFTQSARAAVTDAEHVAREMGAMTVEAEHLLLAVTGTDTRTARVLHAAGLDEEGLREALIAETTRSLAAVGVSVDALHFSPYVKSPKLGHSAKLVLERALKIALARGDKHIGAEHLTLAALQPSVGTVPRALECAGVDRVSVITALSA